MEDSEKGTPIKVKFSDKRRRIQDRDAAASAESPQGSPLRSATEEAAGTVDSSSASRPAKTSSTSQHPSPESAEMSSAPEVAKDVSPERARDLLRGTDSPAEAEEGAQVAEAEQAEPASVETSSDEAGSGEAAADYLDDLRRVQADFDNYRKRMLREQTQLAQRASARLVERLLPVLDNFESAIAHGEGGNGVELVYKELRRVLEEEGLTEIPAEGRPFDPRVHEAFEAVEDEEVKEPTVRSVLRRGYTLKDQVLRPSMVSVARPPDASTQSEENAEAGDETGSADEQDAAEG